MPSSSGRITVPAQNTDDCFTVLGDDRLGLRPDVRRENSAPNSVVRVEADNAAGPQPCFDRTQVTLARAVIPARGTAFPGKAFEDDGVRRPQPFRDGRARQQFMDHALEYSALGTHFLGSRYAFPSSRFRPSCSSGLLGPCSTIAARICSGVALTLMCPYGTSSAITDPGGNFCTSIA